METQGRLRHVYAFKINRKVAKFRHGMARVEKTVFISYRRTNAPWALPSSRTCTTTDMTYFLIMKASPVATSRVSFWGTSGHGPISLCCSHPQRSRAEVNQQIGYDVRSKNHYPSTATLCP